MKLTKKKKRNDINRLLNDATYGLLYTDNEAKKESVFTDILDTNLTVGDCVEFSGEISENGIHNAILLEKYEDITGAVFKFVTNSDRPYIVPVCSHYKINDSKAEHIIISDVDHMTYGQILEIHSNDINKGRVFVRKLK